MGRRLNVSQLCVLAVMKAKQHPVLHQLKHSQLSRETGIPLYLLLVRPYLEYCVQFSVVSVWDISVGELEWVQERATEVVGGWSTWTMRKGSENWICFFWRGLSKDLIAVELYIRSYQEGKSWTLFWSVWWENERSAKNWKRGCSNWV